jgi:hypothetical protein
MTNEGKETASTDSNRRQFLTRVAPSGVAALAALACAESSGNPPPVQSRFKESWEIEYRVNGLLYVVQRAIAIKYAAKISEEDAIRKQLGDEADKWMEFLNEKLQEVPPNLAPKTRAMLHSTLATWVLLLNNSMFSENRDIILKNLMLGAPDIAPRTDANPAASSQAEQQADEAIKKNPQRIIVDLEKIIGEVSKVIPDSCSPPRSSERQL